MYSREISAIKLEGNNTTIMVSQEEYKRTMEELEIYRWRDKKAVILKELDLSYYLVEERRNRIKNAYEKNRPFALIELLNNSKEADDLLIKGYKVDEIIRAVREWVKECLDEIEKEKENDIV